MTLTEGQVWLLIGLLALMSAATKALGPALVGGRELPGWAGRVIAMMAPPLLAALIATAVLADGRRLAVGADTAGVAVAAVLLVCRVPLILSAAAAVVVTAVLRAVF